MIRVEIKRWKLTWLGVYKMGIDSNRNGWVGFDRIGNILGRLELSVLYEETSNIVFIAIAIINNRTKSILLCLKSSAMLIVAKKVTFYLFR